MFHQTAEEPLGVMFECVSILEKKTLDLKILK
jgi:hypothetical protein